MKPQPTLHTDDLIAQLKAWLREDEDVVDIAVPPILAGSHGGKRVLNKVNVVVTTDRGRTETFTIRMKPTVIGRQGR